MEGKKFSISKLFENEKITKVIIILGIIGIALIFLSTFTGFDTSKQKDSDTIFSVDTYSQNLETELTDIITKIKGVGNADVMLTIENSVECVYLDNKDTKTKQIEPIIRGVVVVCDGGDDQIVVQRVIDAVTKALNISSSKVCVAKNNN